MGLGSWQSIPGCFLVGKEKGPLTLVCVGPQPPTDFLGLRCGAWVLLDWGCRLLPLSWVAGSLRSLTTNCLGAKVARGFRSRWEGTAAAAGSQPALTTLVPRRKNQGYLHLITVPFTPPWDTSFTFPLKGSRNLGIIYFNTVGCSTRLPFLAISR